MIVTRGADRLPRAGASPAIVSIGVFDGVHRGHQAILARNVALARELDAVPTVVTFGSHPKQVLLGRAPRTLTTLDHRLALFERAGIAHALVLDFDARLRATGAAEFAREVLIEGLAARAFVLGFDSKFGRDREGGAALLEELGQRVEVVGRVAAGQRAVSSTAIREAVELGDLEAAERMLGRPVSVLGEVVHGEALGRVLGFPTANLDLFHELHPPPGVYAGVAHVLAEGALHAVERSHGAAINIGFRPTLTAPQAGTALTVEVHLLDFAGDLYGRRLEVEFTGRLREERRFADLVALEDQLRVDVRAARELLVRSGRIPVVAG